MARPVVVFALALVLSPATGFAQVDDPLPSWQPGPTEDAIVAFVEAVTEAGGPDYVPPAERIATVDNDGTLWVEQPMYTQVVFAFDRVKALAPEHPEWATTPPFQHVLDNDMQALAATGLRGLGEIIMATHAGMTVDAYRGIVHDWITTARHPRFDRLYTELAYQPQLELLDYLRANGFKTFIVSGGGIEFMRTWAEGVYGIPPEQTVGSSLVTKYEVKDGVPALINQPESDFVDDKDGKPVGIGKFIGRRPILAFGNSDGDLEMLQWTTAGDGRRLGLIVHHDDAKREYAYDRDSTVGRLDRALDMAPTEGWIVVSMRDDWSAIFPPE